MSVVKELWIKLLNKIMYVEELEVVKITRNDWTSYRKEKPKKDDFYLCTMKCLVRVQQKDGTYIDGYDKFVQTNRYSVERGCFMFNDKDVLAWMKQPKPYVSR